MRLCDRNDFKNVGAAHIYDSKYEDNEDTGYLICADYPKDILIFQEGVNLDG
jgi:hypothetical protein